MSTLIRADCAYPVVLNATKKPIAHRKVFMIGPWSGPADTSAKAMAVRQPARTPSRAIMGRGAALVQLSRRRRASRSPADGSTMEYAVQPRSRAANPRSPRPWRIREPAERRPAAEPGGLLQRAGGPAHGVLAVEERELHAGGSRAAEGGCAPETGDCRGLRSCNEAGTRTSPRQPADEAGDSAGTQAARREVAATMRVGVRRQRLRRRLDPELHPDDEIRDCRPELG